MNDTIELWAGSTKALVDPMGAWLTNLSDDNGDIVFPRRRLRAPDGSDKTRGGCHVCLPNFGPGGDSGLPQHGFGRTLPWEVVEQAGDHVVLRLEGGSEGYEALESQLTYSLTEKELHVILEVTNTGTSELRVGPAFHPYFALQSGEARVKIDGNPVELEELEDTLFKKGGMKELATLRRHFRLESEYLSTWALWTDRLAAYICIEPTLGGYSFLQSNAAENEWLGAGQQRSYQLRISW